MTSNKTIDSGLSRMARELISNAGLIDLHVDTYIPYRLFCYDIFRRHRGEPLLGLIPLPFGHLDLPRIKESGLSGAMWSITTNILRPRWNRWSTFMNNLEEFSTLANHSNAGIRFVRNKAEYEEARQDGSHAIFLSIQGGNALEKAPSGINSLPEPNLITRMTLIHMTDSVYGATSYPYFSWRRAKGLTEKGREMIAQLNAHRIFTDLSHIHPCGFWDAMQVHDPSLPVIVTHTGARGVTDLWRNLDDGQIKAVAKTGGVIGIIFHKKYLKRKHGPQNADMVLEHLEHVINVAGEDVAAIGSDYDGFILPPKDLLSGEHYPVLVEKMLQRGWSSSRIKKILSENFLRALDRLRP